MKELLKHLNDYRNMYGSNFSPDGEIVFDEIYNLVNDYAAEQKLKQALLTKNLRHFEIQGCDWYAKVNFHEGQSADYFEGIPYIADEWEVESIYNSDLQELELGEVFDELEYLIVQELEC